MMQASLDATLATVLRDVPRGVLDHEPISAHVLTRGAQAAPEGLDPEEWLDAGDDAVGILRIDSSYSRLDSIGEAEVVVAIASLVPDAVIDGTGRPWPLSPDGRVVDPVVKEGTAFWWDRRSLRVLIGELGA